MIQAVFLIFIGIAVAASINTLFDWRRNKRLDKWNEEPRNLPLCASSGAVRKGLK